MTEEVHISQGLSQFAHFRDPDPYLEELKFRRNDVSRENRTMGCIRMKLAHALLW